MKMIPMIHRSYLGPLMEAKANTMEEKVEVRGNSILITMVIVEVRGNIMD